jgi:hypothetical protein
MSFGNWSLFEILIGRVGNRGRRESFIDEVRRAARKAGPAERPQATERRQLRPPGAIRAGFRCAARLYRARTILRHAPDLTEQVIAGTSIPSLWQ